MTAKPKTAAAKSRKSEQTRAAILEAALDLFLERGYDQTTMRTIAEKAGVSLGNTYYYFRSKEHLIQAFYGRTHEEHVTACKPVLEEERDLQSRLLGVMRAKIKSIEPYHQFAGKLFKTAADPKSPLSPFSEESDPVRREAISVFSEVIEGCSERIPADLRAELPYLLWLYHMSVIMYWIHDASRGQRRTQRLVERSVDLIVKLIRLASHPLMRPLRKSALKLVAELRDEVNYQSPGRDE